MSSPVLKIALIEPNAACAAELGQILCDVLADVSFDLLNGESAADILLVDEGATPASPPSQSAAIAFSRSANGAYTARSLRGSVPGLSELAREFPMPLADAIRLALAAVPRREDSATSAPPQPKLAAPAVDAAEKLHQRLLQAQKMEAVGELAGGIAHDFNNLLMVMRGYTEMLLEDVTLSPESSHHAQEILGALQRASALTQELLAFSRKQPIEPKPTDLNRLVDNAVPLLSRLVGKSITVWVQLPRELWPIRADVGQLEQVLLNLAANARDAMPRGGKLLIETTNVTIEDDHAGMRKGDYVMLAVSDTGQGIPHDVLPRIFEPFFTTKERGKGTGLGLASVYGIVKQSSGYIWAYSEAGYGTTFKIYLPRTAAAGLGPENVAPKVRALAASNSLA